MEMIRNVLLFGLIENFILLLFFKVMMDNRNVKLWQVLLSVPICMISFYIPFPFAKQLLGILFFVAYLIIIKTDIKKAIISVIYGFLYLLCVEMIVCFILEILKIVDLTNIKNDYDKFIFMLPIRAIEFFIIFVIYKIKHKEK